MNRSAKRSGAKGRIAEESLREYFHSLGSYVLRAVPVHEGTGTVTDVDLWIYTRPTAHSRHITIVDIKNRRRSKTFERIIWLKGLQLALRADEAIVASKSANDPAQRFAGRLAIRVIASTIFNAIVKRYGNLGTRLSLEELTSSWKGISIDKVDLTTRIEKAKSEVSQGISFSALNMWVDESAALLRYATEREAVPGPVLRSAYLCCSLVAIAADFLGKDHSFSNVENRRTFFREGMLFGRSDREVTNTYLDFAESLINEFLDPSGSSAAQVRSGFEKAIEGLPIEGLVDFFARQHSSSELFHAAITLENACFDTEVPRPSDLDCLKAKALIGLIGDYAGLPRKEVLGKKTDVSLMSGSDNLLPEGKQENLL